MKKILYLLPMLLCSFWLCGCSDDDDEVASANPPKLISIIPKAGYTGGTAIISGVYFSENIPDNEVSINGAKAEVTAAANNRLVITLPDNPEGTYTVKVGVKGNVVEGLSFRYAPAPAAPELDVLQLMPSAAYAGDEIKVIGQCFSTVAADNKVTINGVEAVVKEATSSILTIVVPDTEEGSYPVKVTVDGKTAEGPMFTYLHVVTLTTAELTPASGKPGQEIVITGEGFGETPADNVVTINGVTAEVRAVTPTSLTIVAPENPAGTYPIVVTVGDKTVQNLEFTYVAETYTVATVAGGVRGNTAANPPCDGQGTAARFNIPEGLALAPNGDIWICDRGAHQIRKMDRSYNVTTVNVTGDVKFNAPWQGAFDPSGNFIVANKGAKNIIKIAPDGAGSVMTTTATTSDPMSVDFDKSGNMYISERGTKKIIKITPAGVESVIDLTPVKGDINDLVVDAGGRIFFVTNTTYKMHMVDTDGTIKTVFGQGTKPTAATWSNGKPGDLSEATIGASLGITMDGDGALYFTDITAFTVRKLTPSSDGDYTKGTIELLAGVPFSNKLVNGSSASASFTYPSAILIVDGIIFVSDDLGFCVRSIIKD